MDHIHVNVMAVIAFTKPTASRQVVKSTGNTQWDETLSQLLEMGFEYNQSLEALQATGYDLTKASSMLAQQSVDYGVSSAPTKDSVEFQEDFTQENEPATKRKDRGYGSIHLVHLMQS